MILNKYVQSRSIVLKTIFISNSFLLNTTGNSNTYIGFGAGISGDYSCAIAIGACAQPTTNGQLAIGSTTYPIATTASAGSIAGYICTNINGTNYKIPYYNL